MNVERSFRIRVHAIGTTDPTDLTVDFTLSISDLAAPPVLPGPICRPFQGKTETQGWNFQCIDNAGIITSNLATAGGRMHLLGRVVQVQMQEDGGAWSTIGTARLANLSQSQQPGLYTLSLEDERWKERNSYVFTRSDTTSLWPQGTRFPYRWFPEQTAITCTVGFVHTNVVLLIPPENPTSGRLLHEPMSPDVHELIVSDVKPPDDVPIANHSATEGSFKTVRAHIDGVEREILSFATRRLGPGVDGLYPGPNALHVRNRVAWEDTQLIYPFWVVWPGNPYGPGPAVVNGETVDVFITAAEHEPEDALPLHIGVADAAHDYGTATGLINYFDAVERAYIEAGVRHDPAAFAALKADPRYPMQAWRITKKRKLADWAEGAAYQPTFVVPFIDNEGRISPKPLHNPAGIDPDTLFVFDATNTRAPHVTWHHGVRQAINILNVQYTEESHNFLFNENQRMPADRITAVERTLEPIEYDTVDDIGPRPITVRMDGLQRTPWKGGTDLTAIPGTALDNAAGALAQQLFEVAGDGPQTGTIHGMLSTAEVASGDLAVIDQDSIQNPNPATNARSGSRIVRILQRTFHVNGYEYEYLDVGPKLQPLAEPTVAIAQNAADPVHSVDITLSDVPAGALATVFIGTDSGFVDRRATLSGVGNGVYTVRGLPAGTLIYAAGFSHEQGRTSSLLSTPVSVATDAAGPTVGAVNLTPNDDGSVTVTGPANAATAGVQLGYEAHAKGVTPTLPDSVDVEVVGGEYTHTFVASIVTDPQFSVGVTPYPIFSGGAVSGTPGDQVVEKIDIPQDEFADPFGQVTVSLGPSRELLFSAHGNTAAVSFRWAASITGVVPTTPNGTVDARSATSVDTGLTVPVDGVGWVTVWFYTGAAGAGTQGQPVSDDETHVDVTAPTSVVRIREYDWDVFGVTGSPPVVTRTLQASVQYESGVASLKFDYSDFSDPSPDPAIAGIFIVDVAAGPATLVQVMMQSPPNDTTEQEWVTDRPDVQLTVLAYDGAGGTGNLLGSDTVVARQDAGIQPVILGGTGTDALTAGALLVGAGSDPIATLPGSVINQVPVWDGAAWTARALGFSDLAGAIASAQVPAAAVTQHQAALSIAATQLTGTIASARIAGSYTGITGVGALTVGSVPATLLTGTIDNARLHASVAVMAGGFEGQIAAYGAGTGSINPVTAPTQVGQFLRVSSVTGNIFAYEWVDSALSGSHSAGVGIGGSTFDGSGNISWSISSGHGLDVNRGQIGTDADSIWVVLGSGPQMAAKGNHLHGGVYSPVGHAHNWSDITAGKPTTLAGYGITDAAALAGATFTGAVTINADLNVGHIRTTGDIFRSSTIRVFTPASSAQGMKMGHLVINSSYSVDAPTNGLYVGGLTLLNGGARVTGSLAATAGAGIELQYSTSGIILCFDRGASTYQHLDIRGSSIGIKPNNVNGLMIAPTSHVFYTSGVERMRVTSAGLQVGTTADLGYRLHANGSVRMVDLLVDTDVTIEDVLTVNGSADVNGPMDVSGALTEAGERVAKVIISTSDPSGTPPHGTIWLKV